MKTVKGRHRLCIAFDTQENMMLFFRRLHIAGCLPEEAGIRYADSLDKDVGTLDCIVGDPKENPGRYIELHEQGIVEVKNG